MTMTRSLIHVAKAATTIRLMSSDSVFVAMFFVLALLSPAYGAITTSGNLDPSNPSTWTSLTHGYIGKTLDGTLRIDGGSDVLAYYSYVGNNSGVTGAIAVDGTGSTWTTGRNILLGMSGRGTLSITCGGSVISGGVEGNTSYGSVIAWLAGSSGEATVDGAGSTWTSNSDFNVGYSGSGTLSITNGGSVISGFGGLYNFGSYIGTNAKSTGKVTVDGSGSTWTNNWLLNVGHKGNGELSIVNGGEVISNSGCIGCNSGANGTVTVDGSDSTWSINNVLQVGSGGNGTLRITNGAAVTVDRTTYVAQTAASTGCIDFGPHGGTLTTASLAASPSNLTGNGTIRTHGLVSDVDLVFDSPDSLKQTLTFIDNHKNIAVAVDMTHGTAGALGAGYAGKGTLKILKGTSVSSEEGLIGYKSGSEGEVTVDGNGSTWYCLSMLVGNGGSSPGTGRLNITNGGHVIVPQNIDIFPTSAVTVSGAGSQWVCDSAINYLYGDGGGSLNITNGGAVSAGVVSLSTDSRLTMDVGSGSSLTITGGFTNNGTVRIVTGAGIVPGQTYTPISAGTWDGSGTYQSFGGTWTRDTTQKDYVFTASSVASGSAGSAIDLDLASVQRVLATDSATGKSASASFMAATESSPISFAATTFGGEALGLLQNELAASESILSGWMFSINGYTDGDPVYLSLEVGPGFSSSILDLWHFDGNAWTAFSANDLSYDGKFANFTVTGFSGYAVSAVPEPSVFALLAVGAAGFVTYRLRKRGYWFTNRALQT
jgi:T5SS/PEP-CTERM-associated repeat protein